MNEKVMSEPTSSSLLSILLYKFLPAALGAAVMVAVDPPKTRRELFVRVFIAFVASFLFADTALDFLHSLSWFSFLDKTNPQHQMAVAGTVGSFGWFGAGGVSVIFKRFKADPPKIGDLKK